MLKSAWNISIFPAHLLCTQTWENLSFSLVLMKMQIHSLPLGDAFGALKSDVSPVTLYTNSTDLTNTALNEIDQSPEISVTQWRGL